MIRNRLLVILVLGLIATAIWTWGPWSRAPRIRNVILLTLDTTRADALGAYGGTVARTPVLDALAAGGHLWTQAHSHAPITLPSHASLLTGLTPPQHGVRNNIAYRLPADRNTLAERLQARGYATAAFVSSIILDSRHGLDQGFEVYEDAIVHYTERSEKAIVTRRAGTTLDAMLAWLDQRQATGDSRPFFTWVHWYDAHWPYDPPLPFQHAYADAPYHGEVAYMDDQIGRLQRHLQALGIAEETLIMVTADHGEAFGQHGEASHGYFCYGATTRVPLIISHPLYGDAGARFDHPVQGIDLLPSILGALALPADPALPGKSLGESGGRAIFSEAIIPQEDFYLAPVHGLRDERYAFYYSSDLELYDLQADPGEIRNIAAQHPLQVERYLGQVQDTLELAAPTSSTQMQIDQATIEQLRSLGYVADGGSGILGGDPYARPSPRASLPVYRGLQSLRRYEERFPFKLVEGLEVLLARFPEHVVLLRDLGRLKVQAGDQTGVELLQAAARKAAGDPRLHTFVGLGLHQFERYAEASAEYQLALDLQPTHSIARYNLGLAQLAQGQMDAARMSFEQVVREQPRDPLALNNLAWIAWHHDRDPVRARELMVRAAAVLPDHPLIKANVSRYAAPAEPVAGQ